MNKLCNSRVSCNGVYFIEYEAKLLGSIKAFSVAVQYRHPFSTDTVDREKIIRQCLLYQKKPWKTFTGGKTKLNLIFVKYTYPTQPTLKQYYWCIWPRWGTSSDSKSTGEKLQPHQAIWQRTFGCFENTGNTFTV